ncbi:MAG: hypothetical protein O7E56_14020 [SAR324 cluster bacterium]|nr:hypothetical protein [SAR324 cluster bacterium]MCZ6629334.1 hypothetical protein [SAR324 cluster bacterium]MCZ6730210.1 hypothetical protein [SAR324 cluster bacterium]MCZ6842594.1 hypothetical protein [SAR324 cluster bacterium]
MDAAPLQWIKGAGDIGSAIAFRMRRAGLRPVLGEVPAPLVTRRRMAFASAVYEGEAELEGLRGVRCTDEAGLLDCLEDEGCVPVLVCSDLDRPPLPPQQVVVDARMRKKREPPVQISEAPFVLGIGPGFRAGLHVHAVVESNWGEELGRVIWEGVALAYTGQHREVEGQGKARYLYAPHAGTFHTRHDLLARVTQGEVVGRVDDTDLAVAIPGILRGLAHGGVAVAEGVKLVEVDPRGEDRFCIGIAERPERIAQGVLEAIRQRMPGLFTA